MWGSKGEKRARGAGAGDVRCGDAVEIVRDVRGEEFDAVVDPLGGKEVWDVCRKVLRTAGQVRLCSRPRSRRSDIPSLLLILSQFTTLVGDTDSALPTANAHFKSNMRSLRRAFVKKDHKSIGYQWVSPVADVDSGGEDVRDSLSAIVRLAVEGVVLPYVGDIEGEANDAAGRGEEGKARVLPFERAPDAFEVDPVTKRCMLSRGVTAVVRVIE